MISYEPLYKTMKEKGITTYTLINKYNIRDKELLEKFEIQKVFAKLLGWM